MPTYEYVCEKCGHQFEYFQSMNDPKLTDCPLEECDGTVKRLLGTGAGIIFKGGGFYETDYRSDSYKKAAKKESGGGETEKKSGTSEKAPAAGKKGDGGTSGGGSAPKPASGD